MDLQLVNKGLLDYACKKRKWVFLVAALGFSGYGAYRVYQSPSVVKKRNRFSKLLGCLVSMTEVAADSAEAVGFISKDLKEFLQSDSDEIPNSLMQVSKIVRSDEFSDTLLRITKALTMGVMRGYRIEAKSNDSMSTSSSFSDKVLDKLFSSAGAGFASVVVGSFARNMFMAVYANREGTILSSNKDSVHSWVEIVSENKHRELIADCIQLFVSTAVSVYLDKTMSINMYDEVFSGMTNPKHEEKVREMLTSLCNGAIETLVKTSHQVLSNSGSSADKMLEKQDSIMSVVRGRKSFGDRSRGNGWMSKVSSTLAVPSNRRFVLDVTGKVTFETVRSFLEFLLDQLMEGLRRGVSVVQEEVVDRGADVFRYMTSRSATVATICLTLCLHVLSSPWILVPS